MTVDLSRDPDYEILIQKLIEKTHAGKLAWEETADPRKFLVAVAGSQTFEVREDDIGYHLLALDTNGDTLFTHGSRDINSSVCNLFRLAHRIATRVDEKIDTSLELLNNL